LIEVKPTRHRRVFLFLMMVLALLPSALKSFLAPHRKCFVFPRKIQPVAITFGVLMRYISSGVWYGLRTAYNEAFLIKLFKLGVFFLAPKDACHILAIRAISKWHANPTESQVRNGRQNRTRWLAVCHAMRRQSR
jgi:hypothetical protein